MSPLSLRETYAGRRLLVTGASGFVGKVWLAMALDRLPELERIFVLLRRKGGASASERFEESVRTSPVFRPLRERLGTGVRAFLETRGEVVEGDVSEPNFGIDGRVLERLRGELDLVINCAGLVDFNPEVQAAISTNVKGAVHAAEFVERCEHAALLHVSTCFVCGNRSGRIEEVALPDYSPRGQGFDAEAEYADVRAAVERIQAASESPEEEAAARAEALRRLQGRGRDASNARLLRNVIDRERRQRLKRAMTEEGDRRAARHGWPNTYTYSKSLAESLLLRRLGRFRCSIFRPAIVESALSFPFPGWNEGFNTSAPLVFLLGTWFRHLPGSASMPFDVVPVDLVANALTIAGAGLLVGRHAPVYQCGTSDRNLLTLGRACELTALGKRRYLRRNGANALERAVLSRWDPVVTDDDHLFSAANLRATAAWLSRVLRSDKLSEGLRARLDVLARVADKADRQLEQVESALVLFRPFIRENRNIFVSRALDRLPVAEPEFRFAPEEFDWRAYWMDVHMPGLRRWCFPQLEGRPLDSDHHPADFRKERPAAPPPARPAVAERSTSGEAK
ncbi:MAG: SDR family oxidoreductase [Planctomycetes bacterium]|nr:SDR family oxidoreductase [Planctomycetota bacterium]